MLLASAGRGQGCCQNILQCAGPPPTTKNYSAPNVNSTEVEKPWSGESGVKDSDKGQTQENSETITLKSSKIF